VRDGDRDIAGFELLEFPALKDLDPSNHSIPAYESGPCSNVTEGVAMSKKTRHFVLHKDVSVELDFGFPPSKIDSESVDCIGMKNAFLCCFQLKGDEIVDISPQSTSFYSMILCRNIERYQTGMFQTCYLSRI
jgi:hypothetical protein